MIAEQEDVVPSHISIWTDEKKSQYSGYVALQSELNITSTIKKNDSVLFFGLHSNDRTFVKAGNDYKLKKGKVNSAAIVGCPYGSVFDIIRGKPYSLKRKVCAADENYVIVCCC